MSLMLISLGAISAALLLAKGISWLCVEGKPRTVLDPDWEGKHRPIRATPRAYEDEESDHV